MAKKPFQPGISANPRGRRKGSVNKFTTLKAAFLNVFERTGGEDGLLKWVNASNHNKAAFYQWITKMLPADVNLGNASSEDGTDKEFVVRVIHVHDDEGGNDHNK